MSQPEPSAGQTSNTSTVGSTTGFLAFGDTGYITKKPKGSGLVPVAAAMKEFCRTEDCRFAVMLGDNIYPDGADGSSADAQRFEDTLIKPYSDLGGTDENFRIYPALGNHDWDTSRVGAFAQISFLENTRPFFMDGPFYSVRPVDGNNQVEIFVIDTQMILAAEKGQAAWEKKDRHKSMNAYPQNEKEKGQLIWLENALEASSAKWKIVTSHHSLWESNGGKARQGKILRRLLLPILCNKADAYFAGHQHTLELHEDDCSTVLSGEDVKPLVHIVSGAAAKSRSVKPKFMAKQKAAYPQMRTVWARGDVWGFTHVELTDETMTVRVFSMPEKESDPTQMTEVFSHSFANRVD
ncbi:MAG: metallophosphoesterase [Robiginitomaculum sp.]|nr:metallophosphoesterase [Robiginitomaculum sp.]